MRERPQSGRPLPKLRTYLAAALLCGMYASSPTIASAPAIDASAENAASARNVLQSMSDYLASQKNLSAQFDVDLDVVTPSIQKLQFAASGDVQLSRPDKLHLTRKGGYSDIELVFDGQTATVVDRYGKSFAQLQTPGSVDRLIDQLRNEYSIEIPAADLLLTKSFDALMDGVVEARHIGVGVVDGVDCNHLAFRNADTDWQLWVRTGDRPLPCKYVITSKTVAAAPEYSVRFHNWKSEPINGKAFAYKPAAGVTSVEFKDLVNIGELPSPTPLSSGDRK